MKLSGQLDAATERMRESAEAQTDALRVRITSI
jgi:hypothetical protein